MSRLPAFPRTAGASQTEHYSAAGAETIPAAPPRQPADDLVRLRMEMLALIAPVAVAGRLNWQDIAQCLEKLEARITAR